MCVCVCVVMWCVCVCVCVCVFRYGLVRVRYITMSWCVTDPLRGVGTFHRGERSMSAESFPWLPAERYQKHCDFLGLLAVMSRLQRQKAVD